MPHFYLVSRDEWICTLNCVYVCRLRVDCRSEIKSHKRKTNDEHLQRERFHIRTPTNTRREYWIWFSKRKRHLYWHRIEKQSLFDFHLILLLLMIIFGIPMEQFGFGEHLPLPILLHPRTCESNKNSLDEITWLFKIHHIHRSFSNQNVMANGAASVYCYPYR